MTVARGVRSWVAVGLAAGVIAGVATPAPATAAEFAPPSLGSTPSDSRAEYHDGNVSTCADVPGVPDDDIQVGAMGSDEASDPYVEGTTSGGKYVNVAITAAGEQAGVVIDAVVVKGGDGYNVYSDPYVPPALEPDQDYMSPLNGGGVVPDLSHWFVCYHLDDGGDPTVKRAAAIGKVVIYPPGTPAEDLPTEYTVTVTCDGIPPFDVTFDAGGGFVVAGDRFLDSVPEGAVCTVEEQGPLPDGAEVRYIPEKAGTTGVTIGTVAVISVVNDYRDIDVRTTSVKAKKIVEADGGAVPDTFTWGVACRDINGEFNGTVDGEPTPRIVTVPGTGGEIVIEDVTAGSQCGIVENTRVLPDGWEVDYAVDGERAEGRFPIVTAVGGETVEVTVTNRFTAAAVPSGPHLAVTGDDRPAGFAVWAAALLTVGAILVAVTARRSRRRQAARTESRTSSTTQSNSSPWLPGMET